VNDDDFEKKLHALTDALHRPDPTPAWKADILARARREATVPPMKRTLPPRWLMLSWAAAWTAILGLNLTAPQDPAFPMTSGLASRAPAPSPDVSVPPRTLLAYQRIMNLNLDLP
jgi:hypothetical protein